MSEIYFLETGHLGVRPLREDDAEEYFVWFDDLEVCRGNSHHRFPESLESVKNYIRHTKEDRTVLVFAIIELASQRHIGNISLQSINYIDRNAELAILCGDKESWGKGYGTEAVQELVRHAFQALNLHRIYLGTLDSNLKMQKLALKAGFLEEGRRKDALYKEGTYHDIIEYGLLKKVVEK